MNKCLDRADSSAPLKSGLKKTIHNTPRGASVNPNEGTAHNQSQKMSGTAPLGSSYYGLLGLDPSASAIEIRRSYRELSKICDRASPKTFDKLCLTDVITTM